ncbi:MAG: acyl--CoA ligase [Halieaceae bacterium]|jgi:acyl-CoA synthetase (AMP-forming)/AMP-acid ligase II|nr:acyl--CoA ligase [Halieaceae bacterium]
MTSHQFPSFPPSYCQRWRDAGLWLDVTLHQGFDDTVARIPDSVGIITPERSYTFAQLKETSDALAAGLLGIGIGKGDIVAVQLPNWIEFFYLQIALARIGAIIQPMHTVFRQRELSNLLSFCETDAVVVADSIKDTSYSDPIREIWSELPCLRKLIVARGEPNGDNECSFDALIEEGRSHLNRLDDLDVSAGDVFYLNFTSGTEGNPKGFLHTHNTLISLYKILMAHMMETVPDTISLACSPMTHSFGHFTSYTCAIGGFPVVLIDRYNPKLLLEIISSARVTNLSGTPAHLIGLLRYQDFEQYDTSCINSVGVGGARSSPELIDELEQVWGVKSANTYGMGETVLHTRTAPDDSEEKIRDTVGRPVFGAELKIVDPKDRSVTLPTGEIGEICFRGATLFLGYHNQLEKTAETRDDEGWFYTSDLGLVDEEGYLSFAGRAKEVINRGGTKIYPKEIEDVLNTHPQIEEAAVVGMPDTRFGEVVCAYIVNSGDSELGVEEIGKFVEQKQVMKYMRPEYVFQLDAMPMTPTGKIRKATLQQQAAEFAKENKT